MELTGFSDIAWSARADFVNMLSADHRCESAWICLRSSGESSLSSRKIIGVKSSTRPAPENNGAPKAEHYYNQVTKKIEPIEPLDEIE